MTTLMFWNLYDVAHDLRAGDETRWRQQVEVVRRHSPDILAITEGWDWHLDDKGLFLRAVRDFGYADGALYQAKTRCDMAVMWREGTESVAVKRQPLAEAWWHGFLRVTLQIPDRAEPLTVLVSHYNPFDPTLRRIEASWLRMQLHNVEHGVLVLDANCIAPGDPEPPATLSRNLVGEETGDRTPLAVLEAAGLTDVGASLGDRTPTLGYYRKPGVVPAQVRLDQAWVTSAVTVTEYQVVQDPETDTASDHRPILISLG